MPERTRAARYAPPAVRLADHTTLRLGGPAGDLTTAGTEDELVAGVRAAAGRPLLVLAGGSNVVVADSGVSDPVLLLRTRGLAMNARDGRVVVSAAAGEPWDELVAATVAAGLAGLECLSGIPGSTGATPIQNVGAYGQEVAETITAVRVYDRARHAVTTMSPAGCGFAYRTSVFKRNDRYIVLGVEFSLEVSGLSTPIRYAELAAALGVPAGTRVPLAEVRQAVLALRAGKGMVLDPDDPDTYSVGSFFTNPVLDRGRFAELAELADRDGLGRPPGWPGADDTVKTSAAWLIERAGFGKGYGHPGTGVAISGKHTLALTNRGNGSTTALIALAREVRDGVAGRFGVALEPEPVLVNCSL